jgi:heme-degrading monooxygenase HmoA
MIARIWRCIVSRDNAPRYVEHFETAVQPDLKRLAGFHGAYILQQPIDDDLQLTVMTLWDSMDAIRGFTVDDVSTAVVAPVVNELARSYDGTVTHSEVVFNT